MNRWQAVLIGFLFLLLVVLVALLLAGCDGGGVGDCDTQPDVRDAVGRSGGDAHETADCGGLAAAAAGPGGAAEFVECGVDATRGVVDQ